MSRNWQIHFAFAVCFSRIMGLWMEVPAMAFQKQKLSHHACSMLQMPTVDPDIHITKTKPCHFWCCEASCLALTSLRWNLFPQNLQICNGAPCADICLKRLQCWVYTLPQMWQDSASGGNDGVDGGHRVLRKKLHTVSVKFSFVYSCIDLLWMMLMVSTAMNTDRKLTFSDRLETKYGSGYSVSRCPLWG